MLLFILHKRDYVCKRNQFHKLINIIFNTFRKLEAEIKQLNKQSLRIRRKFYNLINIYLFKKIKLWQAGNIIL